jgi:hypothetical protein
MNKLLRASWALYARFAKLIGAVDEYYAAQSWRLAIAWLHDKGTLESVQFWGHGSPGRAIIAGEALPLLLLNYVKVKDLVWFRMCWVAKNRTFMSAVAGITGARRVAAHDAVIGPLQPGLTIYENEKFYFHGTVSMLKLGL